MHNTECIWMGNKDKKVNIKKKMKKIITGKKRGRKERDQVRYRKRQRERVLFICLNYQLTDEITI